jgi:DNA polymerase-3 subunit alpha
MIPLHCKTHYSLLKGLSSASQIATRCKELGFKACAITDTNSLSGVVSYATTLSKAGIKPIIGCEFSIILDNKKTYQTILARTNEGFTNLLELLSRSYDDKNYIDEPIITIQDIQECGKGLLIYTGQNLPVDTNLRKSIVDTYKESVDEVFIQIGDNLQKDELRRLAEATGCKKVAVESAYYAKQDDTLYHRLMLCTGMKATLKDIEKDVAQNLLVENHQFFTQNNFYIKDLSGLGVFTQDELEHTEYIESICDHIQFGGKPALPHFDCPNGLSEADYLRQLCHEGWKVRNINKVEHNNTYRDRLDYELGVLQSYNVLNSYFLIVQDYIKWAKDQDWLVGPGRGCFTPDTRVKMSDGMFKPISLVNIGDLVIDAYGQIQLVTDTLEYDIDEDILEIEFGNDTIIRCTKDHKFLTHNRGWVEAQYLTEEDDIVEI